MKLKDFLDDQCINATRFAHKIGISRQSLINYLDGKRTPTIETAYVIEKATNGKVKVYDWLSDNKEKHT